MSIYKQGQTPFKSGRKIRRINKLDAAHSASIEVETEAEGTIFRGAVRELCDYNKIQSNFDSWYIYTTKPPEGTLLPRLMHHQ